MTNILENLEDKESLRRIRIFFLCCAICSMLFYFLMTNLSQQYIDYLPGRIALSIFSVAGFCCTFFIKKDLIESSRFLLQICTISFLLFYLYLLQLNSWSIFHCWSYFVVAAILCSTSMTWSTYLQHAIIGVAGPVILGFWSPMPLLELLHFHSANIATFGIIGIAVHSNFKYKKEIAILTNNLIEQSKMAALGEMAGGISHEINNPLTVIKGAVEHLKRVPPKPAEEKEKFDNLTDKISRMVERITKITSGLREFSQDNGDQDADFHDLNQVIESAIRMCMRKFKDLETEIIFISHSKPVMCRCKINQITQIILNLCSNSVEATRNVHAPFIKVALNIEKDFYIISITDNGKGVADENVTKIMEPFFTTKEIGKGLGLGLSAAHGFAKVHGGELSLQRNKDTTVFNLKLPMVAELTPVRFQET